MFIYNVSIKVNWSIHQPWLVWMQETHISDVMKTNCFTKYQLVKLLEIDEVEGPTYAVQYYCSSKENYDLYINRFSAQLRKDSIDKWSNNFIGSRSLLEVVQ